MEYKYDVAISFAEEDRNAALALALALELQGIKNVYYYPLYYEATWGADLEQKLTKIYSTDAKYAVVFASARYFQKTFCHIEMEAIQKRAQSNKDLVYMLPVIVEPSVVEVTSNYFSVGYVSWNFNPKEIARLVAELLGNSITEIEKIKETTGVDFTLFTGNIVKMKKVIINDGDGSPGSKVSLSVIENSKFLDGDEFIVNRKGKNHE